MDKLTKKALKRRAKEIMAQQKAVEDAAVVSPMEETYDIAGKPAGINAFLLALEKFWEVGGFGPYYRYERVGGTTEDPQAVMVKRAHPKHVVTLVPLADWQRELTADLPKWIFGSDMLTPAVKQRLVETLVILLERATGDAASCWRVETDEGRGPMYACAWKDYLFPTPGGLFLLHMSISD
jgi:hypothetical protein